MSKDNLLLKYQKESLKDIGRISSKNDFYNPTSQAAAKPRDTICTKIRHFPSSDMDKRLESPKL